MKTDIQLGKRCGLKTLMVGSGVDTLETANSLDDGHSPDYFVNTLGDLLTPKAWKKSAMVQDFMEHF